MRRDLIGETLLNQFRIENFIAAGGMATVYRVWDLQRSVPLAMKVLHPELAEDPAFMARFEREAHSLQLLVHPNIVPFYGLFREENLTFLLERYIDGPTLDEVLRWRAGKPMPLVDALVYFKAMYTSLGYAHAQGIIHCDVKPGNVLIDQGGHVYLTDFGIARYTDAAVTTSSGLGTPLYMAPEQIRGERLTTRTDIYSLGIVLFELLTGVRPFRGDVDVPPGVGDNISDRVRYQQLYVTPPDPRSFNPQVPAGLAQVILKALDKDPNQRYPSVQAMANEIGGVVAARFETLPDRVRLPEELLRPNDGWQPEPPPLEGMPINYDAIGNPPIGYDVPGDTIPGQAPSPRMIPELPSTQAGNAPARAAIPPRPRAHIPVRLIGLLGALTLLTFCGLVGMRLIRGIQLGNGPNLPVPQPGQTAGPTPKGTPSQTGTKPAATTQPPAGLSDFPVSGEIAFVQHSGSKDQLYLLNTANDQSTTLPLVPNVNPSVSNAPQWSPDGQRLTWLSQYNGRLHVVVMEMNNPVPYQLPAGETYSRVSSPAFRPDGKQVTFWASGGGAYYMITADAVTGQEASKDTLNTFRSMFVWNWQTSRLAFIQASNKSYKVIVSDSPTGGGRQINTGGEGYAPAWSNDGQWVAFQSDLNRGPGIDEIWIAHPDGSDLHAVTSSPEGMWSRAPSFSPDGKMIAFVSNRSGSLRNDYGELFVVDLSSGKIRQLTSTGGQVYDWRPAWRP
jgi:serine/threonine protein kinase